ncbi:MAG: hypothetical protein ACT4N8_07210 [Sphingosinicella sp.]|uniref:hypothetical protein n=1 Tax=Sphingosinicella sp. TaxID=1917971 RepID=UPI00403837C2
MTDHALDALLAEYVPPLPAADLVGRIVAAAIALPQDRTPPSPRERSTPRHDRRRKWLRRPLLAGAVALGIVVSGAVAANLAGVRLDRLPLVEAVFARLPFLSGESDRESAPPPSPALPPTAQAQDEAPTVEPDPVTPRREPAPPPPIVASRNEVAPAAIPIEDPVRPANARDERILPPVALPPPPVVRDEGLAPTPIVERSPTAPTADEQLRLQREREQAERAARLRAARQAQIERLQRVQQRRERLRRIRRD